jgi:hypothetical protein
MGDLDVMTNIRLRVREEFSDIMAVVPTITDVRVFKSHAILNEKRSAFQKTSYDRFHQKVRVNQSNCF